MQNLQLSRADQAVPRVHTSRGCHAKGWHCKISQLAVLQPAKRNGRLNVVAADSTMSEPVAAPAARASATGSFDSRASIKVLFEAVYVPKVRREIQAWLATWPSDIPPKRTPRSNDKSLLFASSDRSLIGAGNILEYFKLRCRFIERCQRSCLRDQINWVSESISTIPMVYAD